MKRALMILVVMALMLFGAIAIACQISNPYSPGTGHYAGFSWARSVNPVSCYGPKTAKSPSFLEGCQEYLRQKAACGEGGW